MPHMGPSAWTSHSHLELYTALVLPVRLQRGFTQPTARLGSQGADPVFFLYGDVRCGHAKGTKYLPCGMAMYAYVCP